MDIFPQNFLPSILFVVVREVAGRLPGGADDY